MFSLLVCYTIIGCTVAIICLSYRLTLWQFLIATVWPITITVFIYRIVVGCKEAMAEIHEESE